LQQAYEKCINAVAAMRVTSILREAWETSKKEEIDTKEKLSALTLAKDCYSMKLELLTNASVVDDAARFIAEHNDKTLQNNRISDEITKLDNNNNNNNNSTEAETTTTNKVF
jgi:hypothetical protein